MKKILILPYQVPQKFKNSEYLSEGILEELIYLISPSSELNTTSRSTSLYLKNNPMPLYKIKEQFDVDYVLEGSIKYDNAHFYIISQLYTASDETLVYNSKIEFHLDKWTKPLDLLAREITESIVGKTKEVKHSNIDSSKAREYYQHGLYHWNRFTYEEMLLGISFFKRATKENLDFTLAYAALADCYSIIGLMGYDDPIKSFKLANKEVQKALLNKEIRSESYVAAAFVNIFYKSNFLKAKQNLEKAESLHKNNLKVHHVWAMYYIHTSNLEKAEKHSLITIKLDPLALPHYAMITRIYLYQRKFKEALAYVNKGLSINFKVIPLIKLKGVINLVSGNIESAIEDFSYCIKMDVSNPTYYAYLAYAYSKIGFYEKSRELEIKIQKLTIKKETGLFDYAMAIIKLGQTDIKEFFKYIEKSVTYGIGFVPGELINNPIFSEVKKNVRMQKLLIKCNHEVNKSVFRRTQKPSKTIEITTHTNEVLVLDPQDIAFVEGSDNYCIVHWLDAGILNKKMIRITLKGLDKQLSSFEYLVRCHKSFIINLMENMQLKGNAKATFFESSYLPIRIPVSRTKRIEILNLFEKEQANY